MSHWAIQRARSVPPWFLSPVVSSLSLLTVTWMYKKVKPLLPKLLLVKVFLPSNNVKLELYSWLSVRTLRLEGDAFLEREYRQDSCRWQPGLRETGWASWKGRDKAAAAFPGAINWDKREEKQCKDRAGKGNGKIIVIVGREHPKESRKSIPVKFVIIIE